MKPDRKRRLLLLGVSGLLLGGAARAGGLLATPRQPAGPFYPEELPLDHDNDLTRIAGRDGRAEGRITDLIEVNIANLAAVPSIVYGILALALFINFMGLPQSAPIVGGLVLTLMTMASISWPS